MKISKERLNISTVYVVSETIDEYGRLGQRLGIFSSRVIADDYAEGKGWYGGKGDVMPTHAIVDFESNECLLLQDGKWQPLDKDSDAINDEIRHRALAKLSREEQVALGLTK
jgi:hypothetical protein